MAFTIFSFFKDFAKNWTKGQRANGFLHHHFKIDSIQNHPVVSARWLHKWGRLHYTYLFSGQIDKKGQPIISH